MVDRKAGAKGKKAMVMQAILCVLCILIGAFYPTMVDWSKTAVERWAQSNGKSVEWQEARAYPFSPVSVVLIDDAFQLSIALCFVARKTGLRSLWSDKSLVLKMLPLGAIYAIGELLTLRSVQKGSGPVYVVIANMKLVVAALMSRAFFGRSVSMPWLHWFELVLISVAAAAYTLLEAGSLGTSWRWEGAWMALAKSSLVAFSSVFCEHTYKSNPFHLTLTLQAFWGLVTAVLLIAVSFSGLAFPSIAMELHDVDGGLSIFGGGSKHPLCASAAHAECERWLSKLRTIPEAGQYCNCLSTRGWDTYTCFTVLADLSNAVSSALVFRQLSAVAKYVCRALSAVPMYVFYCAVGRIAWRFQTFAVVLYLCFQVSMYTKQRHQIAEAAAAKEEASWVKEYEAADAHGSDKRS